MGNIPHRVYCFSALPYHRKDHWWKSKLLNFSEQFSNYSSQGFRNIKSKKNTRFLELKEPKGDLSWCSYFVDGDTDAQRAK